MACTIYTNVKGTLRGDEKLSSYQIGLGLLDLLIIAAVAAVAALVLSNLHSHLPGIGSISQMTAKIMLGFVILILVADVVALVIHLAKRNKQKEPSKGTTGPVGNSSDSKTGKFKKNNSTISKKTKSATLAAARTSLPLAAPSNPPASLQSEALVKSRSLPSYIALINKDILTAICTDVLQGFDIDGDITRVHGTAEQIEFLTEILGREANEGQYIELTSEEKGYLAAQAIFQCLSEKGQKAMLQALYAILQPALSSKQHILKYLRTYDNGEIRLNIEDPGRIVVQVVHNQIETSSLNLMINAAGAMMANEKDDGHLGSLITLLWHHMPVVLAELDPAKSKSFATDVFEQVQAYLLEIDAAVTEDSRLDRTAINSQDGRILRGLAISDRKQQGQLIARHPQPSLENGPVTYLFSSILNPVIGSQDSHFRPSATQTKDQPMAISFEKYSGRGSFGTSMNRRISFQKGEKGSLRVTMEYIGSRGDWLSGEEETKSFFYEVKVNKKGQWEIITCKKDKTLQTWSDLCAFGLGSDGSWSYLGRRDGTAEEWAPNQAEIFEDLNFIIRSLVTIQRIYTSPFSLVEYGTHLITGQETSLTMLQHLAKINQGKTQLGYADLKPQNQERSGIAFMARMRWLTQVRCDASSQCTHLKKEHEQQQAQKALNNKTSES